MANDSTANVSEIIERGKATAAQRERKSHEEITKKKMQLSLLEEFEIPLQSPLFRHIPNSLARSALFTCIRSGIQRELIRGDIIESLNNIHMTYRGEELGQDDATVFMNILHYALKNQPGEEFFIAVFNRHEFLQDINWSKHSRMYAKLDECIERLKATALTIHVDNEPTAYMGSLVADADIEQGSNQDSSRRYWRVRIHRKILALFNTDNYSRVLIEQRTTIRTELGKWLHNFYSTHREPYPYKVESILKLSGSQAKNVFQFKQTLLKALEELVKIGFLQSYTIDQNALLRVSRAIAERRPALALKSVA